MNIEWSIKPSSKQSCATGQVFVPGEKIISFLYKDENTQELQRIDVRADELESYTLPSAILGFWSFIAKPICEEKSMMALKKIHSAEELFISLFDSDSVIEEKDILKQLLALMLERKRILKTSTKHRIGIIEYIHTKTKVVYSVNFQEWEASKMLDIQEKLHTLLN